MNSGIVSSIFQNLMSFMEKSPMIHQIYGVSCFTYNFGYLHDCVLVLDKILALGWTDTTMPNAFLHYFGAPEASKLYEIIKILAEEVKTGSHDLY